MFGMDLPTARPITVPVLTALDVRLRPFRHDDAAWVYYVSLDPELRRNLSLPDPYLHSHARHFVDHIALATARDGQGADFAIEDPETEIALGWVGIHRAEGNETSCGFWLAADARGRGLMTRALHAACRWALTPAPDGLGTGTVHWNAHVGNHASRAVAEHVGFTIHSDTVPGRNGPKWAGHLLPGDLRPAG
jgi:RimJ/RimL family protein N-acetyltransferase